MTIKCEKIMENMLYIKGAQNIFTAAVTNLFLRLYNLILQCCFWIVNGKLRESKRYICTAEMPISPKTIWEISKKGYLQFSAVLPGRLLPAEKKKSLYHCRRTSWK